MKTIFFAVVLQCVSFALASKHVSSSGELRSALASASRGDRIVLESGTYGGDFVINVDGVTLAGKNSFGEGPKIEGNTAVTVNADNVVVEGMVLKGSKYALKMNSNNGKAQALKMTGNVLLEGRNVLFQSTQVDGDVTVKSSNGKITANKMDVLTVEGCDNVFTANAYTKIHKNNKCDNEIGFSNAARSKGCEWFHFWRGCWWG